MRQISSDNWNYTLYELGDDLAISIICGTVGIFTTDFILTESEQSDYNKNGDEFLKKLASEVRYSPDNFSYRNKIFNLDHLLFGEFSSDNLGSYQIYKLTKTDLQVDRRECWHNDRHTKGGYKFEGEKMGNEKFIIMKDLLYRVPQTIITSDLNGFYTTGNKNEDKLIIEIGNEVITKSVTFDSYEIETKDLPDSLREFWSLVKKSIKLIRS